MCVCVLLYEQAMREIGLREEQLFTADDVVSRKNDRAVRTERGVHACESAVCVLEQFALRPRVFGACVGIVLTVSVNLHACVLRRS